jgi:hypothetical protein
MQPIPTRHLHCVLPSPRAAAAIAALAGALTLPGQALAQWTDANFAFRIGGFFPQVDTKARADGNGGLLGTTIDFESDLGLDDSKTPPVVDMDWRF